MESKKVFLVAHLCFGLFVSEIFRQCQVLSEGHKDGGGSLKCQRINDNAVRDEWNL